MLRALSARNHPRAIIFTFLHAPHKYPAPHKQCRRIDEETHASTRMHNASRGTALIALTSAPPPPPPPAFLLLPSALRLPFSSGPVAQEAWARRREIQAAAGEKRRERKKEGQKLVEMHTGVGAWGSGGTDRCLVHGTGAPVPHGVPWHKLPSDSSPGLRLRRRLS